MRHAVSWKPLLEGAERETALCVAGHILEDLPRFPIRGPLAASLARGQTGVAVLFAWPARALPGSPYGDRAEALLEEVTGAMATTTLLPDLYDGFPGIAWAVQHLQGTPESPDEDPLTDIDAALAEPEGGGLRWKAPSWHIEEAARERLPDGGYNLGVAHGIPGVEEWTDLPGLLAGASGIALALLAATSPVEPAWDRLLLMSLPPGASPRS